MQTDNVTIVGLSQETEIAGNLGKSYHQLTTDDVEGRQFESVEDAEKFYLAYSNTIGFTIRRQRITTSIKGYVTRRRWVCRKEGKRDKKWLDKEDRVRNAKREARENCLTAFGIHFRKPGNYIVTEFKPCHSHDLARPPEVQCTRSNRLVRAADSVTKALCSTPKVEVSDIAMPPWSINLVRFEEYKCDHIDIPKSETYSYVNLLPHVKAVSSDTASALLRQIAGLTSIATTQSLKARDEILRMKREYEFKTKAKEAGFNRLKQELVRYKENGRSHHTGDQP